MQPRIVTLFLVILAISGLACLLVRTAGPAGVRVEDGIGGPVVEDTALRVDKVYALSIDDSANDLAEGSVNWFISPLGGPASQYVMGDNALEMPFSEPGSYLITAYARLRRIAEDTVVVSSGDRFRVDWSEPLARELGAEFSFTDGSSNVAQRTWLVSRAGSTDTLATGNEDSFAWTPTDTGTYLATVEVKFRSSRVAHDTAVLIVSPKPEIPEPEPEPIVRTDPQPRKRWEPKPQPPAPAPVTNNSTSCFPMSVKTEGASFLIKVDKPTREQVKFEDEGTTFKISPNYDCMFTGFEYFANGKIDNIEITIECLNKQCTGRKTYPYKFKGAHDAHNAARASFTSLPILNKDFEYNITVRAVSPGQLGFFPLSENKFKPEKQGNTLRTGEAAISFSDMKTCIYNLRFTR